MDLRRAIKRLMKLGHTWNHALFRERKILIISDSNILSIPLKMRFQQITFLCVVSFMGWSFYSNGRVMAYQGIIAQKEIEVLRSNMENQELQSLYNSLQGEMQGMNSFLDELKKTTTAPKAGAGASAAPAAPVAMDKQTSQRTAEMLRVQMSELRGGVSRKLADYTARMESTIAETGLSLDSLVKKHGLVKARELAMKNTLVADKNAVGGPYIPVNATTGGKDPLRAQMDYLMALSHIVAQIPLGRPIESRHITSGFGVREDPFTGEQAMHAGVDFQAAIGTPIHATAPGMVIFAGRGGEYGNMVEINHGNGISTRYGHMKDILVREGQRVNLGTVVGTEGSTGRSSGPHVHYEVRVDHQARNPIPFLKAGGNV